VTLQSFWYLLNMFDFDELETKYEATEEEDEEEKEVASPKQQSDEDSDELDSKHEEATPPLEADLAASEVGNDAASEGVSQLRVWAISDVHTDYKLNFEWVRSLTKDTSSYCNDCLIVAGDVTHKADVLKDTLCLFKEVFKYVFFVPGNHDLWQHGNASRDSLDKLHQILALCESIGVFIKPTEIPLGTGTKSILVVPILSWHHQGFDTEPNLSSNWAGVQAPEQVIGDYSLASWPSGLSQSDDTVAECLDGENEALWAGTAVESGSLSPELRQKSYAAVISFSHFLPRIELCPEKRFLTVPNLLKAVGSRFLGERVAQLRPDVHVFGHTHFGWDMQIDGTRFVQAPLSYVTERKMRILTISVGDFVPGTEDPAPMPFMVWPRESEGPKSRGACWSSFYSHYGRRPEEVEVLPNYVSMGLKWKGKVHPSSGWGGRAPISAFVDNAQILNDFAQRIKRDAPIDSLEKIGGDFQQLSVGTLQNRLQMRNLYNPTFVFDVRPADAFKEEHVQGAVSVPGEDLHQLALLLPKSRRLGIFERITHPNALKVVYGQETSDGLAGVRLLRKLGSERSTNFAYIPGGVEHLRMAGMKMFRGTRDGFELASGHLE